MMPSDCCCSSACVNKDYSQQSRNSYVQVIQSKRQKQIIKLLLVNLKIQEQILISKTRFAYTLEGQC